MNTTTTALCSQSSFGQQGRKGIAYDWQSLYVAAETAELAALAPQYAE